MTHPPSLKLTTREHRILAKLLDGPQDEYKACRYMDSAKFLEAILTLHNRGLITRMRRILTITLKGRGVLEVLAIYKKTQKQTK